MPAMRMYAKAFFAAVAIATTGTDAGKCCYASPGDCDGERSWCSKDTERCETCKGTFYNNTELEMLKHTHSAAKEASGTCCYSKHGDCDSGRDWCSKSASRCSSCNGTFHSSVKVQAPKQHAPNASEEALPLMLDAMAAVRVPGMCCYSGTGDCDVEHNWCSKDKAHCLRCGGAFHSVTELETLKQTSKESPEAGRCCYTSATDCDMERNFCGKSAARCKACGGTFHADRAEERGVPVHEEGRGSHQAKSEKSAAALQLHETKPPTNHTPVVEALPLNLVARAASRVAGECCYSDYGDCDGEHTWCSKDAAQCGACGGKFHTDTELEALRQSSKKVHELGRCCYFSTADCDNERKFCSKSAARCKACGGTFHANKAEIPKANATALSAEALPLNLAAKAASRVAGECCYTDHGDCDGEQNWCSKDAKHCLTCGGTYHNDTELAALRRSSKKVHELGSCCYYSTADCDRQNNFCSKSAARCKSCSGTFYAAKAEVPIRNSTALLPAHAQGDLFLGVRAGASGPSQGQMLAIVCIASASLAMAALARAKSRRTVTLNSEALG